MKDTSDTITSNFDVTGFIDNRDRSLPPLRHQQLLMKTNEIKGNELLQQSMIKNIKKRNKQNAIMKSTNNALNSND